MSRIFYIDCIGGVAGDMLLGALLDAGADLDAVRDGLARLGIDDLTLETEPAVRHGIAATRAVVGGSDEQPHRTWRSIRELDMPALAQEAFRRLAIAEGRIHGIDPEDVHFHEVGALDAIADVVGVCAGMAVLGLDRVAASPIALGGGRAKTTHGWIPVPGPAVLALLAGAGAPGRGGPDDEELATPTGVALATTLASAFEPMPLLRPTRTGTGTGTRDPAHRPNVVRLVVGEGSEPGSVSSGAPVDAGTALLIETNVDDMDPRGWPGVI
jgi:pyridinium-3,5-bisthiocarboxylic acid mononucleotide nickel chelatase